MLAIIWLPRYATLFRPYVTWRYPETLYLNSQIKISSLVM